MSGLDKENTWVLLIGASKYPNWPIMDIPNVRVNLKELKLLLSDPFYCGISAEKIKIIEDENLEDTNNGIQEFFDNIQTKKETVILYYSGHGLQSVKAMDDLFLATRNIREKTFETSSIKVSELRKLFSECIASRKILLLDCCYAGKITKGFMGSDASENIAKLNDFEGTYILAASSEYERAKFDPENPNSSTKFTGEFIEVIKNGIEFDDEYCTLNSIYNQIRISFLKQKDAPIPVQIGQDNIINFPIFRNKKFLERASKDEQAWNNISVLNNIYAYNLFIEQFPESKYSDEAEKRIKDLEDETAWKKSLDKNTIGGYREYINHYRNHIEEAKLKIKDLSPTTEEIDLWRFALSEQKIDSFEKYIINYPNGRFLDEAQEKIKNLVIIQEQISEDKTNQQNTTPTKQNITDSINGQYFDKTSTKIDFSIRESEDQLNPRSDQADKLDKTERKTHLKENENNTKKNRKSLYWVLSIIFIFFLSLFYLSNNITTITVQDSPDSTIASISSKSSSDSVSTSDTTRQNIIAPIKKADSNIKTTIPILKLNIKSTMLLQEELRKDFYQNVVNWENVKLYITQGADINALNMGSHGQSALEIASSENNLEMVKYLLSKKARFRNSIPDAIKNGYFEMAKFITQAGGPINKKALFMATERANVSFIKWILDRNKKIINDVDGLGRNCLFYIFFDDSWVATKPSDQDRINAMKYLILKGADYRLKDKCGNNLLDYCLDSSDFSNSLCQFSNISEAHTFAHRDKTGDLLLYIKSL